MDTFLEKLQDAEMVKAENKIIVVIEMELNISKIILDSLLSSVTDTYAKLSKDFTNIRKEALLNGVTMALDNPANDFEIKNEYFFEQSLSILQVLKLISVILDLQEQVWLWSRRENGEIDSDVLERITSRTHTAYGRLASFISWPSDQNHPLNLSEQGYINTSDGMIKLRHYLKSNFEVEESSLRAHSISENIDIL